ncbi:hypothetical protein SAV14893_036520 [Streptomyces avermitilis]|uniref:Uncharacterized protein n=1 Tax=Streptomyces avermitilis TaxID=33903 RepID=A0A4D4M0G2_STRAX|nr:hypothetical protein SAV14893_036520 [Streptomyces avermitilis]
MAEIGAGQAEADGRVRAEPVAWFQYDETAPGAHQGGSGAQQLLECVGERVRACQAFGEFVKGREVGDPAGETVLQNCSGAGGGRGRRGACGGGRRRDSVCGRGNR